jgi:hypothetical protein
MFAGIRRCHVLQESYRDNTSANADVLEDDIRIAMPRILDILLIDRTTSLPKETKNIIWANDNYEKYGAVLYTTTAQMR